MVFFFSRLCSRLKTRKRGLKLKGATNGLISRWTYLAKYLKTRNALVISNHAYSPKMQNKRVKLNI